METTILTLVENTAQSRGILAEHGAAFLVRTSRGTVLFDTGQGQVLIPNAAALRADLGQVERIVLSHGHFDHTGGLRAVLRQIGPREVLAHPEALTPKYAVRQGQAHPVGMPESRQVLEQEGANFRLHEQPTEIIPGITATGGIPRVTDFEQVSSRFQTSSEGNWQQDQLWDDQALIVQTAAGPVVVLGCAHAGLINTLLHAQKLVGGRRFAGVIGGTHLVDADPLRLRRTADELRQFDIARIAPCHCTGFRGQVALWEIFGERFVLNTAGNCLKFDREWANFRKVQQSGNLYCDALILVISKTPDSIVKAAMDMLGLSGGEGRLPLIGITPEEQSELQSILKAMGILH